MIPINELIVGAKYAGKGRNFKEGVWTGEAFRGMRYKFGDYFEDDELHWDACTRHGTFKPQELIEYPDTLYGALCRVRDRWRDFVEAVKTSVRT